MNCPNEIAVCLLEIMKIGFLNIRTAATTGDIHRCFVEADHLHNLPGLVKDYFPELLMYYLTVERESFRRQSLEDTNRLFEPLWAKLEAAANIGP